MTIGFETAALSISDVLSNGQRTQYTIPKYQRPYAWKKDQVEQLWLDIYEAYQNHEADENVDANYFLGSVVVIKQANDQYEVVDGQQRLTTLTILLYELLDAINKNKIHFDDNEQREVTIDRLKSCLKNKVRQNVLLTHVKNQLDFTSIFNDENDGKNKKPSKDMERFFENAKVFKILIDDACQEGGNYYINDWEGFLNYLLEQIIIIRIICNDMSVALKLFSVLNARGMNLSHVDIIKSDLLAKTPEHNVESFYSEWENLERTCKDNDEKMQDIFQMYIYYLKGDSTKQDLQVEFKQYFKSENNEDNKIVAGIKSFLNDFISIKSEADEDKDFYLFMLRYLPYQIYWKMILTTAKQVERNDYEKLKELVTQFYYQFWIAGGSRIKTISFDILKKVKDRETSTDEIKDLMVEYLKSVGDYKAKLKNDDVYNPYDWLKAVLIALEYKTYETSKDFIKIDRNLHAEHILPQKWADNESWQAAGFTEEKAKTLVNSLGNFTLLSGTKNSIASNRSYAEKRDIYLGKTTIKGITDRRTTEYIANQYTEWTPDNITNRREDMIEKLEEIFDIK